MKSVASDEEGEGKVEEVGNLLESREEGAWGARLVVQAPIVTSVDWDLIKMQ